LPGIFPDTLELFFPHLGVASDNTWFAKSEVWSAAEVRINYGLGPKLFTSAGTWGSGQTLRELPIFGNIHRLFPNSVGYFPGFQTTKFQAILASYRTST
jgi:hypothetical protein